jgi:hypothetical protein
MVQSNITGILELVAQIKNDYSGDELSYMGKVEECYNGESNRMNLYTEILNNELVYFDYYENSENYWKAAERFTALLDPYLSDASIGDEQGLIDDINKMKIEVSAMKTYADGAYKAIPFSFYQKKAIWADKYNQGLDFQLQYLANPTLDLLNQANTKFEEAANAVEGVTDTTIREEFDEWYNEKITLKVDEVDRQFNTADTACSEAGDLFAVAFPGNANVIKEFNNASD